MIQKQKVGARLKKIREAKKLTQQQVGYKMGYSTKQYIAKIENVGVASFNVLNSYCTVLGVDPLTVLNDAHKTKQTI